MDLISEPPPRGFRILEINADSCVFRYRTAGMARLGGFLVLILTFWTIVSVRISSTVLSEPDVDSGVLFMAIMFWFGDIICACFFVSLFFSITEFALLADRLVVSYSLFCIRRARVIMRSEVLFVKQVKDGGPGTRGEDGDSFPRWGLEIVTKKTVKILADQPIEKSNWLGLVISKWADVQFERVSQ